MKIREAADTDETAMSAMLEKLVAAGRRTMPADVEYVRAHYVANPLGIRCTRAKDEDGNLLGFQSLIHAVEGNPYDTPVGWGSSEPMCRRTPREPASARSFMRRASKLRSRPD